MYIVSKVANQYTKNPIPLEERFWSMVNKNGPVQEHCPELGNCWIWTGCKSHNGYGMITVNGSSKRIHRASWEIHNGPIPEGMLICHHCDNPPCVRPDHLFLGTTQNNVDDKFNKGRNNSKLTDEQVIFIKSYPIYRGSQRDLIKRFNVSQQLISGIVNNKRWKHIINN